MFNQESLIPKVKIFLLSFLIVFVVATLPKLGIRPPQILSPISPMSALEKLRPRLEEKKNTFELKRRSSLIPRSFAAGQLSAEDSRAYAVVDLASGEVVLEKNSQEQLPIASITKIMTAIVALDLVNEQEVFTVDRSVKRVVPTIVALEPGEKVTLRELLEASLLTSANDAAEMIRSGIDKKFGDGTFLAAMNEKAHILGLEHSYFTNPQGFDYGRPHSSVDDVAVLCAYALRKYPIIAEIVKKDTAYFPENEHRKELDLPNWNGLLGVYPNVFGMKIGFTERAGYTTTVASERDGHKLLVVLLGAPGVLERDLWSAQLLDAGFERSFNLDPVEISEESLREKYATWYE